MKMETYQKLSHPAKTFLRGKFKVINTYIKKRKISNNLPLHFKEMEKEEQT